MPAIELPGLAQARPEPWIGRCDGSPAGRARPSLVERNTAGSRDRPSQFSRRACCRQLRGCLSRVAQSPGCACPTSPHAALRYDPPVRVFDKLWMLRAGPLKACGIPPPNDLMRSPLRRLGVLEEVPTSEARWVAGIVGKQLFVVCRDFPERACILLDYIGPVVLEPRDAVDPLADSLADG